MALYENLSQSERDKLAAQFGGFTRPKSFGEMLKEVGNNPAKQMFHNSFRLHFFQRVLAEYTAILLQQQQLQEQAARNAASGEPAPRRGDEEEEEEYREVVDLREYSNEEKDKLDEIYKKYQEAFADLYAAYEADIRVANLELAEQEMDLMQQQLKGPELDAFNDKKDSIRDILSGEMDIAELLKSGNINTILDHLRGMRDETDQMFASFDDAFKEMHMQRMACAFGECGLSPNNLSRVGQVFTNMASDLKKIFEKHKDKVDDINNDYAKEADKLQNDMKAELNGVNAQLAVKLDDAVISRSDMRPEPAPTSSLLEEDRLNDMADFLHHNDVNKTEHVWAMRVEYLTQENGPANNVRLHDEMQYRMGATTMFRSTTQDDVTVNELRATQNEATLKTQFKELAESRGMSPKELVEDVDAAINKQLGDDNKGAFTESAEQAQPDHKRSKMMERAMTPPPPGGGDGGAGG